jgi:hypothetical protein
MKIDQIINEMTSSGAVASVSMRLGATQKRAKESVEVKGLKPVSKLKNAKKKGPYANSIVENKEQVKVSEAELQEDDLIVIPGRGPKRKNGFVPKGQSRVDHEVEMARSDVLATMKNAKSIYHMLKNRSEEEGIEGWVQEKLIKANDYLNAVKEYYDEQMMQEMNGGVIAAGGVGEGVAEGYKEPTTAAGHAKMAAEIKKMLDDTLADRGDRHGNPDPQRLASAYEYHTQKAKEKSQGVAASKNKSDKKS